jgi:ketosteroid isomerase-like protein
MRTQRQFVDAFAQFWRAPSADGLDALLTEDVVLRQPLTPTARSLQAGQREFARIFVAIPDLHALVDRWGPTRDGVLIEFRLIGTLGGQPIEWPVVDRFVLREGMAVERVSYYDPGFLIKAIVTRPSCWLQVLRSGLLNPWRNADS